MSDTLLPLAVERGRFIVDARGYNVASCIRDEDAALFVRAANLHNELVTACRCLVEYAAEEGWLVYRGTDAERSGFNLVRAALAKADVSVGQ